ncbi:MAG: 4Fe-4S dicluster domain-containing protein [Desulfovibrionaceae bacterium]|nr:4Fe-4S dicluster domain-containing protein [Desulfovibrionaceae bacterium]
MTGVNPEFVKRLEPLSADLGSACFNCGTCAAICPLISEHFPRKMIRYVQIGAQDRIMENARELWRCLHCGLCTQTCPRGANPGEVILTLKRYVTSVWRKS